jgi:phospholipase/carboxylesterase
MPAVDEPVPPHPQPEDNVRHGRLAVRRVPGVTAGGPTGRLSIYGAAGEVVALGRVPELADGHPYALVLLLHGAGGSARQGLDLLLPVADQQRLLLVAPQSVGPTWDIITSGFGPDVRRIGSALEQVLASYPVGRLAIGGFSDGASYALTIGLTNGDVFDSVLAFSPGFAAPLVTHGRPRVFVSHGAADEVLPVSRCSRRLVPRLRGLGYDVAYEEFDGGHTVPEEIVRRALAWWRPDEI